MVRRILGFFRRIFGPVTTDPAQARAWFPVFSCITWVLIMLVMGLLLQVLSWIQRVR